MRLMKTEQVQQYALGHELGAGRVVFLATDTRLERSAVMKILHRGAVSEELLRERMLKENPYLRLAYPTLGTYYDASDEREALHWLRKAIFLGNENYPWFAQNPTWMPLHDHADYVALLAELKRTYAQNQALWKRTLAVSAEA